MTVRFHKKLKKDLNQLINQKADLNQKILEVKSLGLKKGRLLRKAKGILKSLIQDQKIGLVKIRRKDPKLRLGGKKAKEPRHACQEPKKFLSTNLGLKSLHPLPTKLP